MYRQRFLWILFSSLFKFRRSLDNFREEISINHISIQSDPLMTRLNFIFKEQQFRNVINPASPQLLHLDFFLALCGVAWLLIFKGRCVRSPEMQFIIR